MSKPLPTVWDLEPHTAKKHEILRRYFEAWLPIMASWNKRILYIDGFAGPGKYSNGDDGSPIIVLKAARDHTQQLRSELVCIFVERDPDRFASLKLLLDELAPSLPISIKYLVVNDTFDEHLTNIFNYIDAQAKALAPALVFIDPFGLSHTPFRTVKRILSNRQSEVLVNFMYEEVNRFLSLESVSKDLDALFGSSKWRNVIGIYGPEYRRRALHDLYLDQLKTAAKYVHSFEMRNKTNSTDYFLFFATNSVKGLEKMKESMWKVDDTGSFQFSDHEDALGLLSLFSEHPNLEPLRHAMVRAFKGKRVAIEKLVEWVITESEFLPKHLKKPLLAPMEEAGEIRVVNTASKRRRGTFPDGTIIEFL